MTVYREGTTREVDCVLPERPALPGDFPEQRTLAPVAGRGSRLGLPGLFP
jgi:hypothetical protein